jgi:hypothetical protein
MEIVHYNAAIHSMLKKMLKDYMVRGEEERGT